MPMTSNPLKEFQSSSPRGGRPALCFPLNTVLSYFNPRPREGDDVCDIYDLISLFFISILVPARGTTPAACGPGIPLHQFQSSSPRGGRQALVSAVKDIAEISILVPARGTTWRGFADTPHCIFQSSSPRGGRLSHIFKNRKIHHNFNPRPREGDDDRAHSDAVHQFYFNPRPREGDDVTSHAEFCSCRNFNPRPREGDDGDIAGKLTKVRLFQSSSPRGGRPY